MVRPPAAAVFRLRELVRHFGFRVTIPKDIILKNAIPITKSLSNTENDKMENTPTPTLTLMLALTLTLFLSLTLALSRIYLSWIVRNTVPRNSLLLPRFSAGVKPRPTNTAVLLLHTHAIDFAGHPYNTHTHVWYWPAVEGRVHETMMLRPGSVTTFHSHVLVVRTSFQPWATRGTSDRKPCFVLSIVMSPSKQSSEYDTTTGSIARAQYALQSSPQQIALTIAAVVAVMIETCIQYAQ